MSPRTARQRPCIPSPETPASCLGERWCYVSKRSNASSALKEHCVRHSLVGSREWLVNIVREEDKGSRD